MKLISYKAVRPGFQALGSYAVRLRLLSDLSHTEVMFMPGDGVDDLMPDGTCEPDADGAYWCASSTAAEKLPEFSKRRAGKYGGVRFKRIKLDPTHWMVQDIKGFSARSTAQWFKDNEGMAYDWRHILSFIGMVFYWIFRQGKDHVSCTEACAKAMGFNESENFNPKNLPPVIERINRLVEAITAS